MMVQIPIMKIKMYTRQRFLNSREQKFWFNTRVVNKELFIFNKEEYKSRVIYRVR